MKECAFLTMENLEGFYAYDKLLHDPLESYGWSVTHIPWRTADVVWDDFDAVIIRSPWDYQEDPERFMNVLEKIDRSSARLENPMEIVRWNIRKTYLRDMEQRGIRTVTTLWNPTLDRAQLSHCFEQLDCEEIIIKPVVGANADHTYRVNTEELAEHWGTLISAFEDTDFMIQPFLPAIVEEGEYSLFFFEDEYSHTILKTPEQGDFRVQEEHGGILKSVEDNPQLIAQGRKIVEQIRPLPLYSRIDLVRTGEHFSLMELELIEPSLYFNMDSQSANRFARVFNRRMARTLKPKTFS